MQLFCESEKTDKNERFVTIALKMMDKAIISAPEEKVKEQQHKNFVEGAGWKIVKEKIDGDRADLVVPFTEHPEAAKKGKKIPFTAPYPYSLFRHFEVTNQSFSDLLICHSRRNVIYRFFQKDLIRKGIDPMRRKKALTGANHKPTQRKSGKGRPLFGVTLIEEYKQILDVASNGIRVVDRNYNMVLINQAFCSLSGVSKKEIAGKKCFEIFSGNLCHSSECPLSLILNGHKHVSCETEKVRQDGKVIPCIVNATAFSREDNDLMGIVEVFTDITKQKKAEKQLQEKKEELEDQAAELKDANTALRVLLKTTSEVEKEEQDKIISNVKKEILPAIKRLKEGRLDASQETYLQIIESTLDSMVSPFLQDLTSKQYSLTPKEIHVADFVKAGKSNKEIAALLHVSEKAIKYHRQNIRKKLQLKNKKINLASYLRSF